MPPRSPYRCASAPALRCDGSQPGCGAIDCSCLPRLDASPFGGIDPSHGIPRTLPCRHSGHLSSCPAHAQLAARLCHYLRPKIHPLLLDASINSPQTVRLNLYQVMRTAVMVGDRVAAGLDHQLAPDRAAESIPGARQSPSKMRSIVSQPGVLLSSRDVITAGPPNHFSQAFLLAAMKFHCYVRALPAAPAPGAALLLDAILSGGCWLGTLSSSWWRLQVFCEKIPMRGHCKAFGGMAAFRGSTISFKGYGG